MTNKKRAWDDPLLSEAFDGLINTNSTLMKTTDLLYEMIENLTHRVNALEEKS